LKIDRVDTEAVKAARQGEGWAWKRLFDRDREMLYRVAYPILLDREEALDVVQEAFIQAFRHLDRLKEDTGWTAWLRVIAVRLALGRARTGRRITRWFGRKVQIEKVEEQLGVTRPTACENVQKNEERMFLDKALKGLAPKQRAAAVLYYQQELTEKQVAETLKIQPGTVKSHLHRARKHLEKELKNLLK
jgi:RNA polymerase sigma-70 factor, ECF subfamily